MMTDDKEKPVLRVFSDSISGWMVCMILFATWVFVETPSDGSKSNTLTSKHTVSRQFNDC
jgi:hypothetical protein